MSKSDRYVLVINCGSSSLKYALFPTGEKSPLLSGLAECLGQDDARISCKTGDKKVTIELPGQGHAGALDALVGILSERGLLAHVEAVGHRVVHGGETFKSSVLVTEEMLEKISALDHMAPLHNPANALGIRTAMSRLEGVPQVAVFDTAFHQTMEPAAYLYALPMSLYRDHGVRRYGFHGTSHRYVAAETVSAFGLDPANHGLVIAHLGNGASATAVMDGRSVDTSMGMTPLEGLVMGTRSGDVDPGALVHISRSLDLDINGLDSLLNRQSGLLGLSELSNDMRTIEGAAQDGHEGAKRALDVFTHRLARYIGALAASLKRFDMLVFTGGIGENSPVIRSMTLSKLKVFGFEEDKAANDQIFGGKAGVISRSKLPRAAVVPTNEEWLISMDTHRLTAAV